MKNLKHTLIAIVLLTTSISCTTQAQQQNVPIPIQRTIEVTGSAEMQIEPNVVKLKIVLRDNLIDRKNEFRKLLKKNGVNEKGISLESMNRYNWWWYYNHHYEQTEMTYMVTIDSTVNAIELMKDLKKDWIRSVTISEKTNTKIQQYRKDVKIEAVKAAKEKATYLLAALDEEIDAVVSIVEVNNDARTTSPNYYWNRGVNTSYTSNSVISSGGSPQATINGVSMDKVRYEVKIVFLIK